jgi:hypothetical protein
MHRHDSRDDSDLRCDAIANAARCLLNQGSRDEEALALLYESETDVLLRVWGRLERDDRTRLLAQAQAGRVIPEPLRSFLAGIKAS